MIILLEHFAKMEELTGHRTPDLVLATVSFAVEEIERRFAIEFGIRLAQVNNLPVVSLN